jgi:hypothetical protein
VSVKLLIPVLVFLVSYAGAQPTPVKGLPKLMDRDVTITVPELDEDGFFPKGPASICVEGPPQRQCYTAPKDFGRDSNVALVQIDKNMPALLFSAASGGVSGWGIHFALLRPGTGKDLENLFLSDMSVSNQSQHAFWTESAISDAPIFLTAEYRFGPDEGHYGEHRYVVSAYILRSSSMIDGTNYWLEDQYLTIRKYDLDANADVLASEKQEILARLARVKAETERQKRTPR